MSKESNDGPYLVLVGDQHTGKSSIISRLSGVKPLGAPCPVEWVLKFSKVWSACVSVSQWHSDGGQQLKRRSLDMVCSKPHELRLLLMRAVILATRYVDGIDVSSLTPEQVQNAYMKIIRQAPRERPSGVVQVYLQLPDCPERQLTVIDLPSLTVPHMSYVEDLVKWYMKRNDRCVVAVVARGDASPQHDIYALSFLRTTGIDHKNVFLILTQTEDTLVVKDWSSVSLYVGPSNVFYVFLPQDLFVTDSGSFSGELNARVLRQQEAAYFQLHDSWALHPVCRDNLGIKSVVKGWRANWDIRHSKSVGDGNDIDLHSVAKATQNHRLTYCGPFTKAAFFFLVFTLLSLCVG